MSSSFSFQMEHLYMDVLYTIKYKVGADTELSAHRDQLYVYAQKAFDVTPEQHRRYMAIVHEEKVSFADHVSSCTSLAPFFPFRFAVIFLRRLCVGFNLDRTPSVDEL